MFKKTIDRLVLTDSMAYNFQTRFSNVNPLRFSYTSQMETGTCGCSVLCADLNQVLAMLNAFAVAM